MWPHQFTKVGKAKQIGKTHTGDDNELKSTSFAIMAQPMQCVHCKMKFTLHVDPYPTGTCPARNNDRELKRIKNVSGVQEEDKKNL